MSSDTPRRLRWKDIPVNYMWTDEETFCAHNHMLVLSQPVDAHYVKFAVKAARFLGVTEVQVLDGVKFEPYDMKIALPGSNGCFSRKPFGR